MKKKILSILLTGALSAAVLAGCGSSKTQEEAAAVATEENIQETTEKVAAEGQETEEEDNKIRIGILSGHVLPPLAEIKGYFEEEGVDAEIVPFTYGAPAIEAITSGDIDICFTGDLPVYSGLSNGVDLTIIATYSTSEKINALVVREDADIKDFSDLKGRTLAVPFGSNIQALLYEYLEAGGLTQNDAEIVNMPCADAVASITQGAVDGIVVWEPFVTSATNEDGIVELADTSDFRTFVCTISGRTEYLESHKNTVASTLRALDKASKYASENKEEVSKLVADYFSTDNADAIFIGLNKADITLKLTPEKIEALKLGAEKNYEYGLLENEIDVEDYIDTQYLDAAGI